MTWTASCLLGLVCLASIKIEARPLVLISETTSTRAIALESISFAREPFPLDSLISWGPDPRTRVILFALNLQLQPGESPSVVTADAEDGTNRLHALRVEYVGPVPGQAWMSAVIVRLNDQMGDVGDVLVRIVHNGQASNRVRIAVGYRGGGPLDDPGSGPTPAPPYVIRGRITVDGSPLFGATVSLSGDASAVTITDSAGNYSILAPSAGNYILVPSKEQDYYTFTPSSVTLTNLSDGRVANFTAALNLSVSPSYVLEFDGAPKSVDHSMPRPGDYLFWPGGVEHGHFFWEFWAMPGMNAGGTYLVSDGYGGAHAILFGFSNFGAREPGRYQLAGNVWNGNSLTNFGSDEGPAINEWGHFAVGWDGTNIVTYFNGVPVGKTAFVGPRITPGGSQGTGRLLIGGSDHANLVGRIAQVRGFERNNPRAQVDSSVFAAYAPQTVFAIDGNLLSYFFRPSLNIADLSLYGHRGRQNPGLVRSTANGVLYPCEGCPLPQFVIDPTAPNFANPNQPGQISAPVDTTAVMPIGALIFDSFSRRNSSYVLSGLGGLSSSEGGILGPQTWVTNAQTGSRQPFGILNGRAVLLANATALAWVNASSDDSNFDIRIDRGPRGSDTGRNTGISFRVADLNNYFFAYSSDGADASQPQTLTVGHCVAGLRTVLASGVSLPTSWTTMRVVTTGAGVVLVYADTTLVYSTSNSLLSNSNAMGLYNNGPGLSLTNRWDNFRVFTAQP